MSGEHFSEEGGFPELFTPRSIRVLEYEDVREGSWSPRLAMSGMTHYEIAYFLGVETIDILESAFIDSKIKRGVHIIDLVTSDMHKKVVRDYFAFREAYIVLRRAGHKEVTRDMLVNTGKIDGQTLAQLIEYTKNISKRFKIRKDLSSPKEKMTRQPKPLETTDDSDDENVVSDNQVRAETLSSFRGAIHDLRRIYPKMTAEKITGEILAPFIKKKVFIAQAFIDNEKDFIAQAFAEKLD